MHAPQLDDVSLPTNADDVVRVIRNGPMRSLAVAEDEIAYWRFGQGPDVVFVHGWPLHAATFRHLVPALARHFTCHLLDLPGAGQTRSRTDCPLDFAALTRALAGVGDQLELTEYALVAHDSGAAAARQVAVQHGARVKGLVLGNTEIPHHHPPIVRHYLRLAKLPGARAMTRLALRWGAMRRSAFGFGGSFRDPSYVDGPFHELFVAPMIASARVVRGQMRLLQGFDFAETDALAAAHGRIEAPVLLVWGTDDTFFPLEHARAMLEQFGGEATLHEIPGAKLFAHEDCPEAFLAPTLPFLQRCFGRDDAGAPG